eukprot:gene32627-40260_t
MVVFSSPRQILLVMLSPRLFFICKSVWIRVGEVNSCDFEQFTQTFDAKLSHAKQNKGSQRSAASNEQGHQKTPTFILAVLLDALKGPADKSLSKPQGGMTDVGLHTGGRARNTAWSLVVAMTEVLIKNFAEPQHDPDLAVFERMMINFDLWSLDRLLSECDVAGGAVSKSQINCCMVVLHSAVEKIAAMAKSEFIVSDLEQRCVVARDRLDALVDTQSLKIAEGFALPELVEAEIVVRDIALEFSVDHRVVMCKPSEQLEAI